MATGNRTFTKLLLSVVILTALVSSSVDLIHGNEAQPAPSTRAYTIISNDTTWSTTESPVIITGNVLVEKGVTLTIDPGVKVKFDGFYYIQVEGKFIAEGNKENMIVFTSNNNTPEAGDWDSIKFNNNADNESSIKFCKFEYGKYAMISYTTNQYRISSFSNNEIDNNIFGITIYYSFMFDNPELNFNTQIADNIFSNITQNAISIDCQFENLDLYREILNYNLIGDLNIIIKNNLIKRHPDFRTGVERTKYCHQE
jgi:hypothetical protein